MSKYNILALFGESGVGKDTIQKWIVSTHPEINGIVSCTTRPPRDYEEHGKDYWFLSVEDFAQKVVDGSMLEATSFNDWFYGTAIESLDINKINVGVFNIQGIECLLDDKSRLNVIPVRVITRGKERLIRALTREENPDCYEICRRYLSDIKDFNDVEFEYEFFYNEGELDIFQSEEKQLEVVKLLSKFN